jgi:hypothetical protein
MQKHPQNIKSYKTTHPAKQCSAQASTVAHGDAEREKADPHFPTCRIGWV